MFGFGAHHASAEEEKAAIKTLGERLKDGTQPVEQQLLQGGEAGMQSLDDVTLERWLRAENFNVDRAEKRLRAHAIWRKEEFPEGRVLESEIKEELARGKSFLQGHDKFGRAVILLQVKKHSRSLRDLKQCMRFLCYSLDKAISSADPSKNPSGKVVGIFDLEGISMDSIDQAGLRGVFDMLQSHYPERLGTLWMYESPGIFWVLWKAVSPFIDPVTKKKVIFVSGHSAVKQMTEEIDLEVLPKPCGGKADLVPIEEAKVPSRPAMNGNSEANQTSKKPRGAESVGVEDSKSDSKPNESEGSIMGP